MTFLGNSQALKSALDYTDARPLAPYDPGFAARFGADITAMFDYSLSTARQGHQNDIQTEFQRKFYQASGQTMPTWKLYDDGVLDGIDPNGAASMFFPGGDSDEPAIKQFNAWKSQNPDSDLIFPNAEFMEKESSRRMNLAHEHAEMLAARSTSFASAAGGFLGTAVGAMADPVNLITIPFGAGLASSYLRTLLIEAGIGMVSETVIQAATYDSKKLANPDLNVGDSVDEVLAAGVGGAVLGTGFKAIAKTWNAAFSPEARSSQPQDQKDAANITEREASVPRNSIAKTSSEKIISREALQKVTEDIVASRPVELPSAAVAMSEARTGTVFDARGGQTDASYELVEASQLITSHDSDFRVNPDFPQSLQPRDRTRAAAQDQVQKIFSEFQPERLGISQEASSGAPIIGPDDLVESGNGRVLALRMVYSEGADRADRYRRFLSDQGFDLNGFSEPVLVARRTTQMDKDGRIKFSSAANESNIMRLSASEQANADAGKVDDRVLGALSDSTVSPLNNRAFTKAFISNLPPAEHSGMVDKKGKLSQEGIRRIKSALFARAFGDTALLARSMEDVDGGNIKNIAGAMEDVAGAWVRMRDAIAHAQIPRGMDITEDLLAAATLVMRSRDEKISMDLLLNQAEMLEGPSEIAKIIARSLFTNENLSQGASRKRIGIFLDDYTREALKNDDGPRLIGEPLSQNEIMRTALARTGREDLATEVANALTPEKIQNIADNHAALDDGIVLEAMRIHAEIGGDTTLDLGDGSGTRTFDEISDELDIEELAGEKVNGCANATTASLGE